MLTWWVRTPLDAREKREFARRYGPLGVPADLKSADKKGSTTLMRICNPPQAGFSPCCHRRHLRFRRLPESRRPGYCHRLYRNHPG